MSNVKKKTYDDTYLFNLPGIKNMYRNHISTFISSSERIENKRADNFRGVIEDIRRYQKSSIIYHVLMRDDVVLCLNEVEMPPSFKVFMAKDPKAAGNKKVFIDASGLLEDKGGYYVCKNIPRLITYLFDAIPWLLYEYEPESLLNNSNITLAATDCFMKMTDYILGYFRFNGYSDNRSKIAYLSALYFMINILGKDDDQYTQQVAAKLAGLDQSLTKAYSLYYERGDLDNINTFISLIERTFKLKGLNTEVFSSRWDTNCGRGTIFATELFTAFTNMMIGAYCGAYVVNQKSIEKQCSSSMVKLCEAIMRLGGAELDRGKVFENAVLEEEEIIVRDPHTKALQEAVAGRKVLPEEVKYTKEDCKSKKVVKERIKAMHKYYMQTQQELKFGEKAVAYAKLAIKAMSTTKDKKEYEVGVLTTILDVSSKYIKGNAKKDINDALKQAIDIQREYVQKYRVTDKELSKVLAAQLSELMKCKSLV